MSNIGITKYTEQYIQNMSFDDGLKVLIVEIIGQDGVLKNPATEETLQAVAGLVPDAYDYISLSYTGENLTGVIFKTGGSGGTTVATLTLAYDGSDNLTSVTKS